MLNPKPTLSDLSKAVVERALRRGASAGYLVSLRAVTEKIARHLPGAVLQLDADKVGDYLASLPGSAHTKNNHRTKLALMLRLRQLHGVVPESFKPLRLVPPCLASGAECGIYTPAEGRRILEALSPPGRVSALPVAALVAWTMLRSWMRSFCMVWRVEGWRLACYGRRAPILLKAHRPTTTADTAIKNFLPDSIFLFLSATPSQGPEPPGRRCVVRCSVDTQAQRPRCAHGHQWPPMATPRARFRLRFAPVSCMVRAWQRQP
jgi:hypothetical protein